METYSLTDYGWFLVAIFLTIAFGITVDWLGAKLWGKYRKGSKQ